MGAGPGGGTALSVEAKKKLLWGKKAEPEAVKVTCPNALHAMACWESPILSFHNMLP